VNSPSYHILFLSSWYPSKVHPTLGNFVQRHAEAVATQHQVDVIYVTPDSTCTEIHSESFSRNNLTEHIWYYPAKKPDPWYRLKTFKQAFKHWLKVNGKLPDIAHLNVLYPAGNQARWLKSEYGVPFVVTEHWTGYHKEHQVKLNPYQRYNIIKTAKEAEMICPVSKHLADAMKAWGITSSVQVVANVVDTELFHRAEAQTIIKQTFLHVSSLVDDHKNISGMLRVICRVTKVRDDVLFQIVGDGDIKPYQKMARDLGIPQAQLEIKGEQSLEQIAELMRSCDVFLMFSRYENLPCVILEAFSSGIPVISSNVGGIHEHLTEDKGILVESEDEEALESAIYLTLDSSKPDPEMLRDYAVKHFSIQHIASQFTHIYQSILFNR
jgi:L-malate glycosyltransferase